MTVKLNLTIEEKLVAKIKMYAAKHQTSVSQLVENLLRKELSSKERKVNFSKNYAGILSGKLGKDVINKVKAEKQQKYGY
jgi:plasmid stability protein